MVGNERHQIAARIAQKFRDAGPGCEIVSLVPTDAAVLRRDRVIVSLALILLTALAWSYVLRLSAPMQMGGMDMSSSARAMTVGGISSARALGRHCHMR